MVDRKVNALILLLSELRCSAKLKSFGFTCTGWVLILPIHSLWVQCSRCHDISARAKL